MRETIDQGSDLQASRQGRIAAAPLGPGQAKETEYAQLHLRPIAGRVDLQQQGQQADQPKRM